MTLLKILQSEKRFVLKRDENHSIAEEVIDKNFSMKIMVLGESKIVLYSLLVL